MTWLRCKRMTTCLFYKVEPCELPLKLPSSVLFFNTQTMVLLKQNMLGKNGHDHQIMKNTLLKKHSNHYYSFHELYINKNKLPKERKKWGPKGTFWVLSFQLNSFLPWKHKPYLIRGATRPFCFKTLNKSLSSTFLNHSTLLPTQTDALSNSPSPLFSFLTRGVPNSLNQKSHWQPFLLLF